MRLMLTCLGSGLGVSGCLAQQPAPVPEVFRTGAFSWAASAPLFSRDRRTDDPQYSVKDPTIVRFRDRWHVFYTVRRQTRTHSIEHVSFADWSEMDSAQRTVLTCREGFFCAPQVFFFRPQRRWYLVYQVGEPARNLKLQPAFSTTETLDAPDSWTPASLFFPDSDPPGVSQWIDFWVICDDTRAYLFFTSLDGHLWRMWTPISDFPLGFRDCQLALETDIFEAGHIYRLLRTNQYLAAIEAQHGGGRYYVAYLADRLDGAWRALAPSWEKPFASRENAEQPTGRWTDNISHGELLRGGYDETLTVDPTHLQFLFQGVSSADMAGRKYGEIPWQLGLLTAGDGGERTGDR